MFNQVLRLVKATQQLDNNKPEKYYVHWETLLPISHLPLVGWLGLFPGTSKEGKNTSEEWNNNRPISTHRSRRAHPLEFTSFLPAPNPSIPAPQCKGLFLKMLAEEASAVATELLSGSQGWKPASDVTHSLISWQDLSDSDKSVEIPAVPLDDLCKANGHERFRHGWLWWACWSEEATETPKEKKIFN